MVEAGALTMPGSSTGINVPGASGSRRTPPGIEDAAASFDWFGYALAVGDTDVVVGAPQHVHRKWATVWSARPRGLRVPCRAPRRGTRRLPHRVAPAPGAPAAEPG